MILSTTSDLREYKNQLDSICNQTVKVSPIKSLTPEEAGSVEIILSYGNYEDRLFEEDLEALQNLKWIQILSSGIEQLPLGYLNERNIAISTVKGIHSTPISEYVLGVLLYYEKKIKLFEEEKIAKNWNEEITLSELDGKTIGILGTGYIGKEIAKKAKAFGMKTIGLNRSGRHVDYFDVIQKIEYLDKVVKSCDYICSVIPSTNETKYIINETVIDSMKDGVRFINVGRGDVLEEKPFIKALKNKKIEWAALDVFEQEPLSEDHPFWNLKNVFMTPHSSARTKRYLGRCLDIFEKNYNLYIKQEFNKMINKVN